jgi:hypothetical protein
VTENNPPAPSSLHSDYPKSLNRFLDRGREREREGERERERERKRENGS